MPGARQKREDLAVDEMGRDEDDVLQVRSAQIGVVQDPDVSGFESAPVADMRDQVLDGELHVGPEHCPIMSGIRAWATRHAPNKLTSRV